MAYSYLTMLDLAKVNGSDQTVGLIEENLNAAPEAAILPARQVSGTSFKSLVRTAYPSGAFRSANEGVEPVKSTYLNRTHETFYYDLQLEMDAAIASADENGPEHALAMEADGAARGYMLDIGPQVWYGRGTNGDAKGFPGAKEVVDSDLVLDATGSTADTASSVWAICAMPKFFELIFGKNTVLEVGEWRKQTITRSSKELTAWKNSLEGWVGAAFYSKYAVGQIKNLTAQTGKTLTDSLLSQLIQKFPIGVKPTHFFMNRRSRQQLQASRTVTLFGQGTTRPNQELLAPIPDSYDGIPIICTDSILSTEAIA